MTILLIYPVGSGGEFIGCTANPSSSDKKDESINRYFYGGGNGKKPLDSNFHNILSEDESHHFLTEGEQFQYIGYYYENRNDVRKVKGIKNKLSTSKLIIAHNHNHIHKFGSVTDAYCLISNSYCLRLLWLLCNRWKGNPTLHYFERWLIEVRNIENYKKLEKENLAAYEDYKNKIEKEFKLITPSELDIISPKLSDAYYNYTSRNVTIANSLFGINLRRRIRFD